VVDPLVPSNNWDWFCLDQIPYHGKYLTILWDKTGEKYKQGKGLSVYVDGKLAANSTTLERIEGKL
jgi:hypothetical protein